MLRIAIFASGTGTNARQIIEYFSNLPSVKVEMVLTNNPAAGVIERAGKLGVQTIVFSRKEFYEQSVIDNLLMKHNIDFLILAGFLWLIPAGIISRYAGKILNIHPALLPKFGGKGMYGNRVHEAVIAAGEHESGITIHEVNERYDEGKTVFQAVCPVLEGDTPETLAARVHELEYRYFPETIERWIRDAGCEMGDG